MAQMGFRGLLDRFAGAGEGYFYPIRLGGLFFSLQDGDFSPASLAEMERRATLYFKRSGQLPLTVSVELIKYGHFPTTIWRMLLPCSNRWKWVHLDAYMTDSAKIFSDAEESSQLSISGTRERVLRKALQRIQDRAAP